MAEKKRKGRKAYLEDFHRDEKGDYVYKGEFYRWQGEDNELRRGRIWLWVLCAGMIAAIAAAGCVEAPGTVNCVYILLPYTINFVAGISVCWGLYRLTAGGDPMRAYIYKASVEQIPARAVCTGIGAGAAVIGELIFVCRNGLGGKAAGFVLFLLLETAVLAAAVLTWRCVKKMKWNKVTARMEG